MGQFGLHQFRYCCLSRECASSSLARDRAQPQTMLAWLTASAVALLLCACVLLSLGVAPRSAPQAQLQSLGLHLTQSARRHKAFSSRSRYSGMGWANGEETDYDEGYTGHSPVNIRLQSIFLRCGSARFRLERLNRVAGTMRDTEAKGVGRRCNTTLTITVIRSRRSTR